MKAYILLLSLMAAALLLNEYTQPNALNAAKHQLMPSAFVKSGLKGCLLSHHSRPGVNSTLTGLLSSAGLGTENLIHVRCNEVGQMLPAALEQALVLAKEQGKVRGGSASDINVILTHFSISLSGLQQCAVGSACISL